jgi:hypothetical protein
MTEDILGRQNRSAHVGFCNADWLAARPDKVNCKGKGLMQTYWFGARSTQQTVQPMSVAMAFHAFTGIEPVVDTKCNADSNSLHRRGRLNQQESLIWGDDGKYGPIDSYEPSSLAQLDSDATARLMAWNCNILLRLLKQIVGHRSAATALVKDGQLLEGEALKPQTERPVNGMTAMNELKEVISFPPSSSKTLLNADSDSIVISPDVAKQLEDLVRFISSMYRPNSFHNYEHVSGFG